MSHKSIYKALVMAPRFSKPLRLIIHCPKCKSRNGKTRKYLQLSLRKVKALTSGDSPGHHPHHPGVAVEGDVMPSHIIFWGEMQTKLEFPL